MRLARYLQSRGRAWRPVYLFSRLVLRHQSIKYGLAIPYNTEIGPGLYIGHYGGVVVSAEAVIGRDCNINHGVTIGVAYGGKNAGVPVIGDRVYFGPGCVVIGGIRLGDDVAVGANAVVTQSVPDMGVVAGVPARTISAKGSFAYVVNTTAPSSDGTMR
jgi:serine O-acetyltransferase